MVDIREQVKNTLNEETENKYYVYALCEKKDGALIPFYIGKGEGDRVWAHEDGADAEKISLEQEYDGEELEIRKNEISNKHKAINRIGDNIEKIIIKCGMTSDEAFMAEGALINLFKMEGLSFDSFKNSLTNEQGGHSSTGEKNQEIESKARTVEQFYDECAKKPIMLDELSEKVLLISINSSYPECKKLCEENKNLDLKLAIRESVRGFWRAPSKPKEFDYLFAVYRGRIKGVYKVENKNPDGSYIKSFHCILDYERDDYPKFKGVKTRDDDYNFCEKLINETKEKKINIQKQKKELFSLLSSETQKAYLEKIEKSNIDDYDRILNKWLADVDFPVKNKLDENICQKWNKLKDEVDKISVENKIKKIKLYKELSSESKALVHEFIINTNTDFYNKNLKNWTERKYYVVKDIPQDDKNYEIFNEYIGHPVRDYKYADKGIIKDINGNPETTGAFKPRSVYTFGKRKAK